MSIQCVQSRMFYRSRASLLGAPGIATRSIFTTSNKKLLGAPGHTRNKDATRKKCIATSNKCLTSSNKKLLETSALLLGTRTLLGTRNSCLRLASCLPRLRLIESEKITHDAGGSILAVLGRPAQGEEEARCFGLKFYLTKEAQTLYVLFLSNLIILSSSTYFALSMTLLVKPESKAPAPSVTPSCQEDHLSTKSPKPRFCGEPLAQQLFQG